MDIYDRKVERWGLGGLPQTAIKGLVAPWDGLRRGYLLEAALFLRPQPRSALVIGMGGGFAPQFIRPLHASSCGSGKGNLFVRQQRVRLESGLQALGYWIIRPIVRLTSEAKSYPRPSL